MIPALSLIFWPVVVVILFRTLDRTTALIVSILAGYLLLPERTALDLPLLPSLDKHSIPALAALLMCVAVANQNGRAQTGPVSNDVVLPGLLPKNAVLLGLLGIFLIGSAMTVMTNQDMLFYGPRVVPALRPYDMLSNVLAAVIMLIPFILGRKYLASPEAHLKLLTAICIAAFAYSFLALYEVRMSPQINRMVYGFFPHSWVQHIRAGGFRPLVFLEHGLLLGIYLCMAVISAAVLARLSTDNRPKFIVMLVWLMGTLYLSKNLGATGIMLMMLPLVFLLPARLQLGAAAAVAVIVISYPYLRGAGLLPVDAIADLATSINEDRASSFMFRLNNEDELLAKANERPLFGWGGWSRSFIFNHRGEVTSITDGLWIIRIGQGGWADYTAIFGLMVVPIVLLFLRASAFEITLATSGLALIMAANMIDLIPNAGITPLTWLIAGGLAGRLELARITSEQSDESEEAAESGPRNPYARTFKPGSTDRPLPARAPAAVTARNGGAGLHTRQKQLKRRGRPAQ